MRTTRAINLIAIVLSAVVLATCGAAAPTSPSPASDTRPTPTPESMSPTPTTGPTPTTEPTPAPLVLAGTWVRPEAGATLTSYTTTLSARPSATGDGETTFTKVVFSATWAGAKKQVACRATRPDNDDVWSCKANLLALGVPPGKVAFSFDVAGVGVPVAHAPDGTRRITYAVPPPRPGKARLIQVERPDYENGDNVAVLHRVRWTAPAGYAEEFLVYETWECPRPSTEENNGKPCFVAGTPVDVSMLELLATAPGDARSVKVRLSESECGPSHGSILLRARNSYGKSVFAIVSSAPVIWVDPNDTYC